GSRLYASTEWQSREVGGNSFFFSSRRRHTRFSRDWSSDVCSSDLGVTVWLVHHDQTALRPATTHGLDHGIHFPRMVAVVVDQHHAALVAQGELAMHLESAAHALEAGQPLNDGLVADALVRGHGNGRKRIEHVVHAGHVDEYPQRLAAFAQYG